MESQSSSPCLQKDQVRIMLWCYPRTLSTVLTKCLSFIEGMEVWFEPFTYCDIANTVYQAETGKQLPLDYTSKNASEFELAASLIKEKGVFSSVVPDRMAYGNVKSRLESTQSKRVLVKDTGGAVSSNRLREYIPAGYQHVFLIRDPATSLNSYRRVRILIDEVKDEKAYDVERDDTILNPQDFYPSLHSLWTFIRQNVNPDPVVINADDLTTNPGGVLRKLCDRTGLPYSDDLLHWDASTDVVKRWKACGNTLLTDVPTFFHAAATSSEFQLKTIPISRVDLTEDVLRLVDIFMPLYEEMNKHKI